MRHVHFPRSVCQSRASTARFIINNGSTISNTSGQPITFAKFYNMYWNGNITFLGNANGTQNLYFSASIGDNNDNGITLLGNTTLNVTAGTLIAATTLRGPTR